MISSWIGQPWVSHLWIMDSSIGIFHMLIGWCIVTDGVWNSQSTVCCLQTPALWVPTKLDRHCYRGGSGSTTEGSSPPGCGWTTVLTSLSRWPRRMIQAWWLADVSLLVAAVVGMLAVVVVAVLSCLDVPTRVQESMLCLIADLDFDVSKWCAQETIGFCLECVTHAKTHTRTIARFWDPPKGIPIDTYRAKKVVSMHMFILLQFVSRNHVRQPGNPTMSGPQMPVIVMGPCSSSTWWLADLWLKGWPVVSSACRCSLALSAQMRSRLGTVQGFVGKNPNRAARWLYPNIPTLSNGTWLLGVDFLVTYPLMTFERTHTYEHGQFEAKRQMLGVYSQDGCNPKSLKAYGGRAINLDEYR